MPALGISQAKAKKILKDGEINGKPLTDKQRKLFGLIASGKAPTRLAEMMRHKKKAA